MPSALYNPVSVIPGLKEHPELLEQLAKLNQTESYAFTELMLGALSKHYFTLAPLQRPSPIAANLTPEWDQWIPCLHQALWTPEELPLFDTAMENRKSVEMEFQFEGVKVRLEFPGLSYDIARAINCNNTIQEVFQSIRNGEHEQDTRKKKKMKKLTWRDFLRHFQDFYQVMRSMNVLTLRKSNHTAHLADLTAQDTPECASS